MRIAFGFDIFYPETNGVITTTINLANNLIELGHEVYFFVPKDKDFTDEVIEKGIKIVHVNAFQSWIYKGIKILPYFGWYLQKELFIHKIDIIHNTSPWLMGMALNHAARRLHIPTIATHHTLIDNPIYIKYALKSEWLSRVAPIWKIVLKPFYKLSWLATAPNEDTCTLIREKNPKLDVRYVSNGINISKFTQTDIIEDIPSCIPSDYVNKNTLIFIGRLGYEKSIDITLKAFAKVIKENKEAKLLLIGEGPARKALEKIIEENDLHNNVLLTGIVENKKIVFSKLLTKVAAFVTASKSENQAMTVIEALCSSCPVICAKVNNMTALVSENQGWHFEPDNIDDLADQMKKALSNTDERENKAISAGQSIDLFDGRNVAKQFLAIYEELLKKREKGFHVPKGEVRYLLHYEVLKNKYSNF